MLTSTYGNVAAKQTLGTAGARTWTKHGKLPWVNYSARETEKVDEDMPKFRTLKDVAENYLSTIG